MPQDRRIGIWKIYAVDSNGDIGLHATPTNRSRVQIIKVQTDTWKLKKLQNVTWEEGEIELTRHHDNPGSPTQVPPIPAMFTGKVSIKENGPTAPATPHKVKIWFLQAAQKPDDELIFDISHETGTGPIAQGTANSGRG